MPEARTQLIERLCTFYHSAYTQHNRQEVRAVPFPEWLNRQLISHGFDPEPPIRQPDKPLPQLPRYARMQICRRLAELTMITKPDSRACAMYWKQFNRMAMRFETQKETRTG